MKIKNWLKNLVAGICIGISSSIPGVSGGTMAVIFNVYEKIIWAVSNIFKSFGKAIKILLPILLGLIIGMIPTIILVDKALDSFLFGLICIFAGFIIGSIPHIKKEVEGVKPTKIHIIVFIVCLLLTVALGVASVLAKTDTTPLFEAPKWWFYLLIIPVGFIAAIALVVPGISGGMILILFGFYKPLINSTVDVAKECLSGDWSHFGSQIGILLCFGVGVIAGFFIISKIMNHLLTKYRDISFYGILGFIFGSIVSLFLNNDVYEYYINWSKGGQGALIKEIEIPLGIALLIICAVGIYFISKYAEKHQQNSD